MSPQRRFGLLQFTDKTFVPGNVPARFRKDIVDAHIPAGILRGVIMDMDIHPDSKMIAKQQRGTLW
jgi:hypothetical protein